MFATGLAVLTPGGQLWCALPLGCCREWQAAGRARACCIGSCRWLHGVHARGRHGPTGGSLALPQVRARRKRAPPAALPGPRARPGGRQRRLGRALHGGAAPQRVVFRGAGGALLLLLGVRLSPFCCAVAWGRLRGAHTPRLRCSCCQRLHHLACAARRPPVPTHHPTGAGRGGRQRVGGGRVRGAAHLGDRGAHPAVGGAPCVSHCRARPAALGILGRSAPAPSRPPGCLAACARRHGQTSAASCSSSGCHRCALRHRPYPTTPAPAGWRPAPVAGTWAGTGRTARCTCGPPNWRTW